MSRVVDSYVTEMRFDNKQFESNVKTSMSTLDKLKQSLNLKGASKGLENISSAAKRFDMSGMGSAVESVHVRFSALEVMAVTALANITNSAVNTGRRIVSALTIEPVTTGFREYETQINAVQTILANTASKGTSLQQVNSALDELNTYADKTIYNFTEMTRNIGNFTAAGVDLKTSVSAIQGIANLAAISGSTSMQASSAMYQLSQALAAGKVQLMDWNSVVNAGMGGEVFQNALKRTATQMGYNVDALIEKYGSFRESLTKGEWLTAEVLTETLAQLSGAYSEADLIAQGYTEKQAKEIVELANTAVAAATEVKTFTQLWDTLKEAVQSGWAQSWEIMIGDFEEAKSLLTEISDTIGGMLNASSEARNKMLSEGLSSGWKQLLNAGIPDEQGYIETIKLVAREHGNAFDKMIKDTGSFDKALKMGLKNGTITSGMLSKAVTNLADKMRGMSDEEKKAAGYTQEHIEQIEALEQGLKNGSISMDDFVNKMNRLSGRENLIQALQNSFEALVAVAKPIKEAFRDIFPPHTGEQLYALTEKVKKFSEGLKISGETADKLKRTFKGVFSIFDIFGKTISAVAKPLFDLSGSKGVASLGDFLLTIAANIGDFFTSINEGFDTNGISGDLSKIVTGISNVLETATEKIGSFGDALSYIGQGISNVASMIGGAIKTAFTWITDNVSAGDIFAGLAGGGIFVLAKKISDVFGKIKDILNDIFGDKSSIKPQFGKMFADVLDSIHGALESFTTGIKVASLVGIAIAIGILSASIKTLSQIEPASIGKSLFAIGSLLTMLSLGFRSITKSLKKFDSRGVVKSGVALILVAKAISILADTMIKLSDLSMPEIAKGLIAIGGALVELSVGLKIIGKTKIPLSTSIAMLALAESCKILGDAFEKFSSVSWDEIGRGLTAMGGALGELVAAISVLSKTGGFKSLLGSVGILIAVQALEKLSEGLKSFAEMSWDEIGRGLAAMGGALGELGIVFGVLGKVCGFSSILASGAILITIQGLSDLVDALKQFGGMTWEEIGRGLSGMGGALSEVAAISGVLGKLAGFSGLLGAGAILLGVQSLAKLTDAFKCFAGMTWEEIGKGLTGMGAALGEVAVISGVLGKLTGLSGLLGSGAILLGVQALGDLVNAFEQFGDMNWDEIARGLVGMGGALSEVAVISGALGSLAPLGGLIGSGSLLIGIQGLGDLANALKKFGEMNWDEIGRGLTAMGAALGQTALGGLLNTLSGLGAYSISLVAEPLGTLADSVKKWSGVTVPEGLGLQLSSLANGILSFTFGGFGASAIAELASPLGILADSVMKWNGVVVPEGLGNQIASLANGVLSFTFGGFGAGAIAEVAAPLGALADSIRKWSNITIPDGLESGLKQIANGIMSFTFAFAGGWSIGAVIEPLGSLSEAVKKWNGVNIPEGLEGKLKSLADGVKSFTFAFVGSWTVDSTANSLTSLADALKKWNGITIPSNIGSTLESLASGVESFAGVGDTSSAINSLKSIASTSTKLAGINFTQISSGLTGLANAMKKLSSIDTSGIASLKTAASSISTVARSMTKSTSQFSSVGSKMADNIAKGFRSKQSALSKAGTTAITSMLTVIKSKSGQFQTIGVTLMTRLVSGINSQKSKVKRSLTSALSSAASSARGYYGSFYSAGAYVATGFANGISANSYKAAARARAMAAAAASAARAELAINSPSKVFRKIGSSVPEGFAQGIGMLGNLVKQSSVSMARNAMQGTSDALARIADTINSGMDVQPTIRPVLDLSDIQSGAGDISRVFGSDWSIGATANMNAISSMMNRRNQNGVGEDIISAINKLRGELANVGNTTNIIEGVTYDDGSHISEAVGSLVRAIRIERRS